MAPTSGMASALPVSSGLSGKWATAVSSWEELSEPLPTAGMCPGASSWGLSLCLRQAKTLLQLKGEPSPALALALCLITRRAYSAHNRSKAFAFHLGFLYVSLSCCCSVILSV